MPTQFREPRYECVDLQSDVRNCGSVGHACPNAAQWGGGGFACVNGACVETCTAGPGGQCIDSGSDPASCGSGATRCAGTTHGFGVCTEGVCGVVCEQGFVEHDGRCLYLASDPGNCGAVGNACPAPAEGVAVCSNGACGSACVVSAVPACSGATDLLTDPTNCGTPGNVCPGAQLGLASCAAGACANSGLPVVAKVNGVPVPGRKSVESTRNAGWGGITLEGAHLDAVTRVDLLDYGDGNAPVRSGLVLSEAITFSASATSLSIPSAALARALDTLPGRWVEVRLFAGAVSYEVDFALRLYPHAGSDVRPTIDHVYVIRNLVVSKAHNPATGFIGTSVDYTKHGPAPVALCTAYFGSGVRCGDSFVPIERVVSNGLFVAPGGGEITGSLDLDNIDQAHWDLRMGAFVFPYTGQDGDRLIPSIDNLLVQGTGLSGGNLALASSGGQPLPGFASLWPSDSFTDGQGSSWFMFVLDGVTSREAFLQFDGLAGRAVTPWPLRFADQPELNSVTADSYDPAVCPSSAVCPPFVAYDQVVTMTGRWLEDTTAVRFTQGSGPTLVVEELQRAASQPAAGEYRVVDDHHVKYVLSSQEGTVDRALSQGWVGGQFLSAEAFPGSRSVCLRSSVGDVLGGVATSGHDWSDIVEFADGVCVDLQAVPPTEVGIAGGAIFAAGKYRTAFVPSGQLGTVSRYKSDEWLVVKLHGVNARSEIDRVDLVPYRNQGVPVAASATALDADHLSISDETYPQMTPGASYAVEVTLANGKELYGGFFFSYSPGRLAVGGGSSAKAGTTRSSMPSPTPQPGPPDYPFTTLPSGPCSGTNCTVTEP